MKSRVRPSRASVCLCGSVAVLSIGLITKTHAQTSSSPASTSVVGRDLTGTYSFQRLECYSRSTGELTLIGTISNYYNETIEIRGNSFLDTFKGGSCTASLAGSIVFTDAGTFSIPDTKLAVPGGKCSFTANLTILGSGGSQALPAQVTYTDGQNLPAQSGQYRVDPTSGAVSAEFNSTVSYPTSDPCFEIFSRS